MKINYKFLLGALLLVFAPVYALDLNLYKAEVPVASESPDDRTKAFQKGLVEVLTKISQELAIQHKSFDDALRDPIRYVQAYSYQEKSGQLILAMDFSKRAIRDFFAPTSSVRNSSRVQEIDLCVTDLHAVDDYASILRYFKGLSSVEQAELKEVSAESAHFHLVLKENLDRFKQAVAAQNILLPEANPAANAILTYHYHHEPEPK